MITDINKKTKTQIHIFPLTSFSPNETQVIFEKNNAVGRIRQITFDVNSNNNTNWKNTVLKIYVNDNADESPDLIISSDDIVNGLGYTNYNRKMLDVAVYRYSNNRRSKVTMKLNFDFFKNIKIEATAGNGNTTIGVWILYDVYYYSVSNN